MKKNIFLSSLQNSETLALASRAASASAAKLLCSFIGTEQSLTFWDRKKDYQGNFDLWIKGIFDLLYIWVKYQNRFHQQITSTLSTTTPQPRATSSSSSLYETLNLGFWIWSMMLDISDLKFNTKWYLISWPILYFHLDSPGDRFPLGENFPKGVVPQYIPDQLRF